jgi:hypothetical protein
MVKTLETSGYELIVAAIHEYCWRLAEECFQEYEKLGRMMDRQAQFRGRRSLRAGPIAKRMTSLLAAGQECLDVAKVCTIENRACPELAAESLLLRQSQAWRDGLGTYHKLYRGKVGALYARRRN